MRPLEEDLPAIFVQHAADILADTNSGLSGAVIVRATAAYALKYDVTIPHATYPRGGLAELANMFVKLVDYYTKYHNTYVKHDDAVIEEEIEFVLEITSAFMKHLVRLHERA